ncbi:MAG: IS110 family transposase [Candidatus Competibacteraceae bacterium]|nr:IS110 family transposase [Candidatus Competibacteraceae bacterium]
MRTQVPKQELFQQLWPDSAGIDVGSSSHFVSVPPDRDSTSVREFSAVTSGLEALADWLKACRVVRVAMESTGVYWIALFELLCERGFEVVLVDARRVKNVSGRKSDVLDCEWLRRLHSYGLLSGAFRPESQVCALRAIVRHRMRLIEDAGRYIQRMQKSMHEMNIKLDRVVSDVTGHTGLQIIRAIAAGERDPKVLAGFRDKRCRASAHEIEEALKGHFRAEHVFVLSQALACFDFLQLQIAGCDEQMEAQLSVWHSAITDIPKAKARKATGRNHPSIDLHTQMVRLLGVDVSGMPGMDPYTVLRITSEVGVDMSAFATVGNFTSWMGLCPGTKVSGGKVLSSRTAAVANKAARAFRLAAWAAGRTQTAIGAFYRRLKARLGAPKAITATAHKMARIFYTMVKTGTPYEEHGAAAYEQAYRERTLQALKRRAQNLGFELVCVST